MTTVKKSSNNSVSLKEVRRKLKINQSELAKRLGTDQANISNLERGKEIPEWLQKALVLHAILRQAGYSFDDLILDLPDPEDC